MKVTMLRLAVCCLAVSTSVASAQIYAPPTTRPTATYRSPAQPSAPRVAYVAARPTTSAPATVVSPPAFRPINPPNRPAQRTLVANRTQATVPTQVRPTASVAAQPVPQPMGAAYQPPMNGQPWIPPTPSMPYDQGMGGGYGGGPGMAASAPPPVSDPSIDYGSGGDCGSGACGAGCGGGHCCGLFQHGCCIPIRTTGDLVQHMPFSGTTHGYYYFRPYHVMHVFSQQELATRWGGDPRNPYDNTIFQRIYEQMGVEARPTVKPVKTDVLVPTVAPDQEYLVPGQTIAPTPTPVPMYGNPGSQYLGPQNYGPSRGGYGPSQGIMPLPGVEPVPTPIP